MRESRGGDGRLTNDTSTRPLLVVASASISGSSPRRRTSRPSLSPGMLHCDSHERLDQAREHHLARECV